jgi:Tol biopolymer transport system component
MRGTLVSARGLQPRVLLNPGEVWGAWSRDGTRLLYTLPANGTTDLGMLTLADGSRRRLTTTPEAEEGAEFAADGNTVVFRRTKRVERLHVADLSRLRGGN